MDSLSLLIASLSLDYSKSTWMNLDVAVGNIQIEIDGQDQVNINSENQDHNQKNGHIHKQ